MANKTRKHTQHGIEVKQVEFSGNWYTVVDSRILIANHAKLETVRTQAGYSVVEHAMVPVGERWAYTCRIEYPAGSQHYYPGSDFIDLSAKDGLAKAETSAIGRALGLAGIAIEGGIASAEEMEHAQPQPQPQRKDDANADGNTGGTGGTWDFLRDAKFRQYVGNLGYETVDAVETLVAEACGDGEPSKKLVQQELVRRANLQGLKARGA